MDILPLSAYPRAARSRKANVAKYRVQEAAEKQLQLTQPSRGGERKAVASSGQAWGLNSKAGKLAPKTQDRSKLQKKEVDGSAPDRNTEPLPQAKGVKRKAEGMPLSPDLYLHTTLFCTWFLSSSIILHKLAHIPGLCFLQQPATI